MITVPVDTFDRVCSVVSKDSSVTTTLEKLAGQTLHIADVVIRLGDALSLLPHDDYGAEDAKRIVEAIFGEDNILLPQIWRLVRQRLFDVDSWRWHDDSSFCFGIFRIPAVA